MPPEPKIPTVVTQRDAIRTRVVAARTAGRSVGLVPTMGALHAGHLSLVKAATEQCDTTVVSIFVNPTQFSPGEDFEQYPRDIDRDIEQLAPFGVDAVFVPQVGELYSSTHSTFVEPPEVASQWEGACRPGHFRGVATVVVKLFNSAPADLAFFGQKDYQQARVIERVVEELDIPTQVRICPTIREADGLAMSSRNAYLDAADRTRALGIHACLHAAYSMIQRGTSAVEDIRGVMREALARHGIHRIDYATVVHPLTMNELDRVEGPAVAIVAAHVGTTRLIDNLVIHSSSPDA